MVKYNPNNITKDSNFIFDFREKKYKILIEDIKDLNVLKPNEDEINFLKKYINDFSNNLEKDSNNKYEGITPQFKDALRKFVPGICEKNEAMFLINDIIQNYNKREKLTLKIITKKFNKKSKIRKSKTNLYNIMKNKLGYKFLKTTPKTKKLEENSSIIRSFAFIKSFIKCIQLNLEPIFLDESNFQMVNNKLKIWRKKKEGVTFNVGKPGGKNIILAVSQNKMIFYEINDGTNKSDSFLNFFNNLMKIITPMRIKKLFLYNG